MQKFTIVIDDDQRALLTAGLLRAPDYRANMPAIELYHMLTALSDIEGDPDPDAINDFTL